jgi:hypothetical protein
VTAASYKLTSGNTRSCGCLKRDLIGSRRKTHGATAGGKRTPEHQAWKGMIKRCGNPAAKDYAFYGGRGVRVCERWRLSFAAFLADVGDRPSANHTLDRFPNNNGNYEPGNVRWATRVEQMRNTRANHLLTHNGETRTIAEWAEVTGLAQHAIWKRLRRGWGVAESLTIPLRARRVLA